MMLNNDRVTKSIEVGANFAENAPVLFVKEDISVFFVKDNGIGIVKCSFDRITSFEE